MDRPEDLLAQTRDALEPVCEEAESSTGIDRRQFMFRSLVAAAASTFGVHVALEKGYATPRQQQQATEPLIALGNGEPPAMQFQAYPGGTGAFMEKLALERGRAAFERAAFTVEPWSGPLPSSDEEIAYLPAHRLAALIRERRLTSARLTDIYLERMKRLDPILLCAVTIIEDGARAEARRADAEIAAGQYRGPLHAIPYGIKDLFSTRGVRTTWGSADFQNRIIDEDAEIVVRLRAAGAVLLAKLATGLFANNDNWYRGRTNNPWDIRRGSSGSSAGPASATAAGCVGFAIGTETGGSIVSPARECGISALRPTFGRVSRYGGMVLSWTRDRAGPLGRTIEDCAMVFNVIQGVDEKDPSTVMAPFQFQRDIDLASVRIGFDENAPPEFVAQLRELGANPRPIAERPRVEGAGAGGGEGAAAFDFYVQMLAEELGIDMDKIPEPTERGPNEDPGNPSKLASLTRRANQRRSTALEFLQGQRRRHILQLRMWEFMRDLDMYVQPATGGGDTGLHAQCGNPCTVVPYKFESPTSGVPGAVDWRPDRDPNPITDYKPKPICAVVAGSLFNDDMILSVAHKYQVNTDWHLRHPST